MPPVKYIQQQRLDRSLRLLSQTMLPIVEIAMTIGYPDVQTYIRAFRKQYNLTPAKYRQSIH